MSENDPVSDSILDALPAADSDSGAAADPPHIDLPTPSLVQEPRWPHPNFWWSLLWCALLWLVMQLSGGIVGVLVVAAVAILSPRTLPMDTLSDPEKLFKTDTMNVALALGQFTAEILALGLSWLAIRLVVGRDWPRQLAVRRPGLAHMLLVLASFPVMAFLANVAYSLVRESRWVPSISDPNPLNVVYFWAAVFVVLGIAFLAARLLAGSGWTHKLAARPARPIDLLVTAAVLPVLIACMLILYQGLRVALRAPGLDEMKLTGMEEMTKLFGNWPLGFAVLVIGVGPGIGEELWCRGFLGRGLVGSHGVVLGVLASSFFFGLIHTDPCQGTMAMVVGLWLHFVYLCTRSLLLPMLLHFLNNSLNVLALHVPALKQLDAELGDIPLSVYATGLLLLASVAYALYQSRAQLAANSPEQLLLWRPAFEGVEYPPSGSGARVVHPPPSLAATMLTGGSFALFIWACRSWIAGS